MFAGARRSAALATVGILVAGCGLLGGGDSQSSANGHPVDVAIIPGLLDGVPLQLANDPEWHLFGDAGLSVNIKSESSGSNGVDKLASGEVPIAYMSITTAEQAQVKLGGKFTILQPAAVNADGDIALVVKENGPIKTVADLAGKKIAINGKGSFSEALVREALADNGCAQCHVDWLTMTFDAMPQELQQDQVDAALVTEPDVTLAAHIAGAVPLVNYQTGIRGGATRDLPLSVYVSTVAWANSHPAEVREFRQGLRKAAKLAHDNPTAARNEIPRFVSIDPTLLQALHPPAWPEEVSPVQMQRVPDLMWTYHFADKFDISPMLYDDKPPSSSASPSVSSATSSPRPSVTPTK